MRHPPGWARRNPELVYNYSGQAQDITPFILKQSPKAAYSKYTYDTQMGVTVTSGFTRFWFHGSTPLSRHFCS